MNAPEIVDRHRNRDGVVVFPGGDPRRDIQVKQFLGRPVDSRRPFSEFDFPARPLTLPARRSGPSEETKREWQDRLVRVRGEIHRALRRPISSGIPDISRRELSRLREAADPYEYQTIEELAGTRGLTPQGAMFAQQKLPKLRHVPDELAHARFREKAKLF